MRERICRAALVACVAVTSLHAAEPPARVVSLAPSLTEIVFALGAGDRLVGVSSYCDYPEEAKSIDRVGTFLQPNIEVILASRPDLLLVVPSPENQSAVEALRDFGVRVRVIRAERIEEVLAAIEIVASDLEVEKNGSALVSRIRSDLSAVEARLSSVDKRRVLMVVGRRPLIAAGAGTYQSELIARAGGVNIVADAGEAWPHLSIEHVIVEAPDVIIDSGMNDEDAAQSDAFWSSFPTIPAVKHGRVVGSGRYDLLRPGPRAAATLETMARFIHPEVFATVDSTRKGESSDDEAETAD